MKTDSGRFVYLLNVELLIGLMIFATKEKPMAVLVVPAIEVP
jgi:hypothetical protein